MAERDTECISHMQAGPRGDVQVCDSGFQLLPINSGILHLVGAWLILEGTGVSLSLSVVLHVFPL